ncbi:L-rhamnose 1-epimeras-like protein [Corynespora cassiicola Philippines]|uniref:L-rhamnose 1-epimeras-like protein n=1 Tax=Corynespora cassiicola Philippines TaxID=1448308 RepID=A0A2T2NUK7_CORCC|nr:L-rhamnose 1-epimeras-like protein [Corynespora cassiicola Philippines]
MSSSAGNSVRRIGQMVYLKPEYLEEYKKCHAAVWPEVLEQIKDSNIKDYSIYFLEVPRPMLFASFKWVGSDWDEDMKRMAANPKVQEWWKMTDSYQESPHPGATGSASGPWWQVAEEVFYTP